RELSGTPRSVGWASRRSLVSPAVSLVDSFSPSVLQRFIDELKQRLGGRIAGHAEVRVDPGVSGFPGAENRDGKACLFQHVPETLSLRARIGMLGNVQDQERRDALIPGHVSDGGKVAMLHGIV